MFAPASTAGYHLIPIPGTSSLMWVQQIADPEGLGRDWGFAPLSVATIDVSMLAEQLSNATPLDTPMIDPVTDTQFIRRLKFDTAGAFIGTEDFLPDGTAFAPSGSEVFFPEQAPPTVNLGSQSLAVPIVAFTLTPPAGADWAQLHVYGGDLVWTTDGSVPDDTIENGFRNSSGTTFWLTSPVELAAFQFKQTALSGATGLYVEYFSGPRANT